jgi:TatD DNase family protein
MIDIGANLTNKQFKADLPKVLQRAKDWNVDTVIVTGTSLKCSQESFDLVAKYDEKPIKLYSTAGIHPHTAKEFDSNSISTLKTLLEHKSVVAVGECGLDYDRMFSTLEQQKNCFEEHLKLAVEVKKPLFLHERDAFDDFYSIISKYSKDIKGVVHCFTGKKEHIEKYVELGLFIGITGFVCNDNRNQDLLKGLSSIPLDRLMIETDAPFMSPPQYKHDSGSNRNEPEALPYTLAYLAKHYGVSEKDLENKINANTKQFFNL